MLCIPTDGTLERNSKGIEFETARIEYAIEAEINANRRAALPPNISPNLP